MGKIYFIMGVAGSGKSTIGELLAKKLNMPFFDADDFHPPANIQKMAAGTPLDDADRLPWLENIARTARQHTGRQGAVIACSALKSQYRSVLAAGIEAHVQWIYLQGNMETIRQRMENRKDHFMPPGLLRSQFDALEPPQEALIVDISESPEAIVARLPG